MGKVPANEPTEISDPSPHENRPPRLATCINEEASSGKARRIEPDRTAKGDGTWQLAEGTTVETQHLTGIIRWICDLLENDKAWADVWSTDAGQHPNPDKDLDTQRKKDDETWAKRVEELFLGTAYGGPDIAAQFPPKDPTTERGKSKDGPMVYIYSRFFDWQKNGELVINDPAYSLIVACQTLATYGALARGVKLDPDLARAGIPASQAACGLPIFKGHWHTPGDVKVIGTTEVLKKDAPWEVASDPKTMMNKDTKDYYGPGTVYTYNPAHLREFYLSAVKPDDLVMEGDHIFYDKDGLPVTKPDVAQRMILDAQKQVKAENKEKDAQHQTGVGDGVKDKLGRPIGSSSLEVAKVPMRVQLDGSHASMILRLFTATSKKGEETKAVQLLDTGPHIGSELSGVSSSVIENDYVMFKNIASYAGIYATEGHKKVEAFNSANFVGCGCLPPISNASKVFQNLLKARPVGLARLIIAKRQEGDPRPFVTNRMTEEDIYFVSAMIRLWGNSATQNFTPSRLLWSLRNTPYRRNIQAFWVAYAPRGALAEVLWETGARGLTLDQIEAKAVGRLNGLRQKKTDAKGAPLPPVTGLHTGRDLRAIGMFSHDQAGRAIAVWKDNGLKASGEGAPPKVLRELFIDTGAPALSLLTREREKRLKTYLAEVEARRKRIQDLSSQYGRAKDAEERADIAATLEKEKDPPYEEQVARDDLYADPAAVKPGEAPSPKDLMSVRLDPRASYTHPEITHLQAFLLPALLRWHPREDSTS